MTKGKNQQYSEVQSTVKKSHKKSKGRVQKIACVC
jgi:hypothetical protein